MKTFRELADHSLRQATPDAGALKHPFPRASDRSAWEAHLDSPLNRRRREWLVGKANDTEWPQLFATGYMEYVRTGNRSRFEVPCHRRRARLGTLVLAECCAGDGALTDRIIDALWSICEETSWCAPAHIGDYQSRLLLPDSRNPVVDLFASQTGFVLAESLYLVGERLDAVSPLIGQRVRDEINERGVEPVERKDDFWWYAGQNNWTPWCASNVLGAALYTLQPGERLSALILKLCTFIDRFVGHYAPDGGCDEGPMYWGRAAGEMCLFAEQLIAHDIDVSEMYAQPLIKAMGEFIVTAHVHGPWFLNFADAVPRIGVHRAVTYRYGERIGSRDMMNLAMQSMTGWVSGGEVVEPFAAKSSGDFLLGALRELFWIPADLKADAFAEPSFKLLPDTQVMISRSCSQDIELYCGAKGGHNDENHNHNDVGQFVIYAGGEPVIVDVGKSDYTRETFGPNRYSLWNTRSSGHNVPIVNGFEQKPGRDACAGEVHGTDDGRCSVYELDIAAAYPREAGVKRLTRRIVHRRADAPEVLVTDTCDMHTGPFTVSVALLTPLAASVAPDNAIELRSNRVAVTLRCSPGLEPRIETIPVTDNIIAGQWGTALTQIVLLFDCRESKGEYLVSFTPHQ